MRFADDGVHQLGRHHAQCQETLRYLYFQEDEHPITAQLFGANPAVMAEAAKMVEDLGYDAVDINLGCPPKKWSSAAAPDCSAISRYSKTFSKRSAPQSKFR